MTSTDSSSSSHSPHVVAVIITDPRIPTSLLGQILHKPIMYNAMVRTCTDFARLHGSAADWKRHYRHKCTSVGFHADHHDYDWRGLRAAIVDVINDVHSKITLKRGGKPLVYITCLYRDVKLIKAYVAKNCAFALSSNMGRNTFMYDERLDSNRTCRVEGYSNTWAFPHFIHKCAGFTVGETSYRTFNILKLIPSTPYSASYMYINFCILGGAMVYDKDIECGARDQKIREMLADRSASEEDIARVIASVPNVDNMRWEPKLKWFGLAMEMQELLTVVMSVTTATKCPSPPAGTEEQSQ